MFRKAFLCVSVFVLASAVCGITLDNDDMAIEFGDESDSFGIRKIVNKISGNREFLHRREGLPNFWGLRFVRKVAGTNVYVNVGNSQPAKRRTVRVDGNRATFAWQGMPLPGSEGTYDVTARVEVPPKHGLSSWTIQVRNHSERWTLEKIQYPFFHRIVTKDDAEARVLAPAKGNVGGQLFSLSEYGGATKLFSHYYPSDQLQMTALMSGRKRI